MFILYSQRIKNYINGIIFFLFGLLFILGPQYLFKVCMPDAGGFPVCHWSAQAEIGIGALIAALGIGCIVFEDKKIRFGLVIGVFRSGVVALCIPHILIGGCGMSSMACRKTAFPCITLISIVLMFYSLGNAIFLVYRLRERKDISHHSGS